MTLSYVQPPTTGIRHQQPATDAHVQSQNFGTGTLYITEGCVRWISNEGQGLTLTYPSISLHAVSRDTSSFPHECLYLMVDSEDDANEGSGAGGDASDSEEEAGGPFEVRFVPQDKGTLDLLYKSMCDCQMLHPDPEDAQSDEGDYYGDEEDIENLTPEGQAQLERLENIFLQDNNMERDQEPQIGAQHSVNGSGDADGEPMDEDQFEDAD